MKQTVAPTGTKAGEKSISLASCSLTNSVKSSKLMFGA